jgi:hypothetical protein
VNSARITAHEVAPPGRRFEHPVGERRRDRGLKPPAQHVVAPRPDPSRQFCRDPVRVPLPERGARAPMRSPSRPSPSKPLSPHPRSRGRAGRGSAGGPAFDTDVGSVRGARSEPLRSQGHRGKGPASSGSPRLCRPPGGPPL